MKCIEQGCAQRRGHADRDAGAPPVRQGGDQLRGHAAQAALGSRPENLKDPYRFDFLGLGEQAHERELESALVQHALLELGAGVAFIGRQKLLDVGGDEFFIDLPFHHLKLRCSVVIELKGGEFKPEYVGKLGFYLTAIDEHVKAAGDAPRNGLLLCMSKTRVVADYALRDSERPDGTATAIWARLTAAGKKRPARPSEYPAGSS